MSGVEQNISSSMPISISYLSIRGVLKKYCEFFFLRYIYICIYILRFKFIYLIYIYIYIHKYVIDINRSDSGIDNLYEVIIFAI